MPSICPGGGDDSPFLGCFPSYLFCNLVSDCPGGVDEDNCTNNNTGKDPWLYIHTTCNNL